jgi:thioredoxin-like negative regulator of GroEL
MPTDRALRPRGRRGTIALALLSLAAVSLARADSEPGGIAWVGGFEEALEAASLEGRPVLVDFHTSWCGWCKKMERETYRDPVVIERTSRIVCVRVDAEKRTDLARSYGVRAFPTLLILNPDGSTRQMLRGYQSAERFVSTLDGLLDERAAEFTLLQRLKDHPELVEVRKDLAMLLLRQGRPAAAASQFDTLSTREADLAPQEAWEITFHRARALLGSDRPAEARKLLESLVKGSKDEPRWPQAVFYLAESAWAAGDRKEARKWYRRLLEVKPEGWFAARSRERLDALEG